MESASEPVTVVVRRLVKPGKEALYERWLAALIAEASQLPGYLGTEVHRPATAGPREYTSVFRFDSVANLRRFEESDLRRRSLGEVVALVEADATWETLTGLEVWFEPPAGTVVPQPSRFRMAVVLTVVVYGLVLSIGKLVGFVLADLPLSLRLLITIIIEVIIMTYALMPWINKRFARFIYPLSNTETP